MILNVDGGSIGNPGISDYRGLNRNSDNAWIHDFAGNIGFLNILHAELLAVNHMDLLWHGTEVVCDFGRKLTYGSNK
jgi:hypothetical protein